MPRKAAEAKRTEGMAFKFTRAEAAALRHNAKAAGMTATAFVVHRCTQS